jgi:hypothetical protein
LCRKTLKTDKEILENILLPHNKEWKIQCIFYRERMGPPIHDTKPTPVDDPNSLPIALVKTPFPGVIELHVTDSISGRKAKPAGVHGFKIAWVILDTPPTDWSQLTHSSFSTQTPFRLSSFSGNERGKIVYFALRWENTRGVKGPWTEITNAIIP